MKVKLTPKEYEVMFFNTSIFDTYKLKDENPVEVTEAQAKDIALDAKAAAELFEGPGFTPGTGSRAEGHIWRRIQKKFESVKGE